MSKARGLADLGNVYDDGALSNRNLIINSAMQVAQRGTSSTSNGYVSLDRWYVNQSGGSTTFSQETNSNPSETDGLQKYARLNVSSSSDYCHIRQPIEDVTSVPSGTVTLSFYAKGTAPAGGLYTYGIQYFGSGGSTDVDWTPVLITSTLTSSWVRYTAEITVPSIDGKTIGSGSYFLLDIGQYSNTGTTAYDLNITGVQLEVGDTATPFEHRSFGDEMARCQRYFQRFGAGTTSGRMGVGAWNNSTSADIAVNLTHEMRAIPTVTAVQGGRVLDYAVAWHNVTSLAGSTESTTKLINLNLQNTSQPSAATQGDSAALGGGGAPFDYWVDAEL
jgi:hypothetical protein